ncbi:MAG: non-homologous end-joining DNA ligase [Actinomycetota bacterium]|nr:non-homologous end-joining DNA ligase [Actinomycetota bacterium]
MAQRTIVSVGGRQLSLSNLDKVLYPSSGTTKAAVIDYYVRVGPAMLRHLAGRPITLKRFPDGVAGGFFYEKNCPEHRPPWVPTVTVTTTGSGRWGRSSSGPTTIEFCLIQDLPALVWVANLAALELHPYLHRADAVDRPTLVVFDLDPGAPAGIIDCGRVALRLRGLFAGLGLDCVVKTSGGKGLQVYLPLNTPVTYDQTTPFAKAVAQLLERQTPDRITSNMNKAVRGGKVFVDWSQNSTHKTTVGAYSLRARERPTVSTPLRWDEIEEAVDTDEPDRLVFELGDVVERVERHGELFGAAEERRQELPALGP